MRNLKLPENVNILYKKPKKRSGFQYHYLILTLCMSVNAISYAMRTNINLTIVAMVKDNQNKTQYDTCNSTNLSLIRFDRFIKLYVPILNQTFAMEPLVERVPEELPSEDFDWSESLQGTILGAYYYGYIVAMGLGGQLADLFGTKKLITGAIALSSVCTLLIPVSAFFSAYMVVAVRVLTGLAQGVVTPAIYTLLPNWIPQRQLGIALGLIAASGNVGVVIAMPICAILAEYGFAGGWPSVFYVFGAVGILLIVPWWLCVFNSPDSHPRISADERDFLKNSVSNSSSGTKKPKAPWGKILTSRKIWAMSIAKFFGAWGNFFMLTKLPAYLKQILHMSITTNSYVNASTNIALGISFFFWGWVSDFVSKREWFSKTVTRKLFQSFSVLGSAFFLAMVPVAGCNSAAIVAMLILSMVSLGMAAGGENLVIVDVAPDYSGSIYGFTNSLANLPGFLAPLLVGVLLDQSTSNPIHEWNIVLWTGAAFYALGGIIFIFGVNSQLEKWGRAPESTAECGTKNDNSDC